MMVSEVQQRRVPSEYQNLIHMGDRNDCLYDNNPIKGEKLNSASESLQSLIFAPRRRDCILELRTYVPPGHNFGLPLLEACLRLGKIKAGSKLGDF